MKYRAPLALAAGLLSLSVTPAIAASADAAPAGAHAAPATAQNQCTETYEPSGSNPYFGSWFGRNTTVHFRNPSGAWGFVQVWSSTSYWDLSVPPHGTYDLTKNFWGFGISMHVYGPTGLYVSFPNGPC